MKKLRFLSTTILFLGSIAFGNNSLAKAGVDTPILPIEEQNIYSISFEPNPTDGGRTYILEIYSDQNEKNKVVSISRPLDGKLIDVKIDDVDDDNVNELIVMMVQTSSLNTKAHFDVFEFDGKKISWVRDFMPTPRLFTLFEKYIR